MTTILNAIFEMVVSGVTLLAERLDALGQLVYYGIVNLLLGSASEFLVYVFAEKLEWLPSNTPPEWFIYWVEIANNVLPLDDWCGYLALYLTFESVLFIHNWTLGFFWGAV